MGRLLLLFALLPLIDLWLLLRIGRAIGFWPALGLVVFTAIAGAWLARAEGFRVLRSWQSSLAGGSMPEEGVLSGVLVLVGAALLVSPGVLTDLLGIALLLPPVRRRVATSLRRRFMRPVERGRVRVVTFGDPGPFGGSAGPRRAADEVVDVTPRRDP